jgi:predicted O-linked N-acetylglucosamine transferase (SPINDLY family)
MLNELLNRLRGRHRAADEAKDEADRLIAEGNRLEDAGDARAACERYRAALGLAPQYARAHLNLGIALEALGEAEPARRAFEAALAIDAGEPYANYNLGKLLFARGAPAQAEPLLRRALQARPDFPEALVVLAGVLEARADPDAAAAALEAALRARPDYPVALRNYAALALKLGRRRDAEPALRRIVALDPEDFEATQRLATLLAESGAAQEAEALLRAVLSRDPRSADAHAALFDLYRLQGDLDGAQREIRAALELRPDWAGAHYAHGVILRKQKRTAEAEAAFRRAVALDPAQLRAQLALGSVVLGQCRVEEACAIYRAARSSCADTLALESAELFALSYLDEVTAEDSFARHAAYGSRLEQAHPARFEPLRNAPDPERRLRVGYVSGDLMFHVVTQFLLPLVERHDRAAVEVCCYSTGDTVDDHTRKLMARADLWRDVSALSDAERADLIHRDGIDVLVDLAGHSGVPNLAVFAQRPAPVQATWVGYLNTTGLTRIRYRISDSVCDPPGLTDRYHTETLVRLPHSQWCYRPFVAVDAAGAAPLERNGFVTFGSFNQAAKISPSLRRLWAAMLSALPDARLVIGGVAAGRATDELYLDLARGGIGRERVTLVPYLSVEDYLRGYNGIDIALDTSPYSGGTTTCDALWMGVPVVTVPGVRPSSRSAASLLTTVGLEDWIAATPEDYVRRAVHYARERSTVAGLRRSLRERMRGSPLMDEARFVRDMEDAYRGMWRAWCRERER